MVKTWVVVSKDNVLGLKIPCFIAFELVKNGNDKRCPKA